MIYPGTQDAMSTGGVNGDAKKKLAQMMAQHKTSALPLFGGSGRSANDLPSVGAPAIGFNPFLAMLAGRPGENFGQVQGQDPNLSANAQAGLGPVQGGGSQSDPNYAGYNGSSVATSGGQIGTAIQGGPDQLGMSNPGGQDATSNLGGHYNDKMIGAPGTASAQPTGGTGPIHPGANLGDPTSLDPQTASLLLMLAQYGGNR